MYAAFGFTDSLAVVITIFLVYGLYFGLTEGAEKAWVADMAPAALRGTAFGIYNAALGVGGLAASLLFGLLWTRVSPTSAFLTGAGSRGPGVLHADALPGQRTESPVTSYQ